MSSPRYKLIDLFCGCGGLSRGFERSGRFGTQLGIELEPHPAAAFKSNIRNVSGQPPLTIVSDISEVCANKSSFWDIIKQSGISRPEELDVLAGGPPCQGFSRNGVRQYADESRSQRFYDDPRNHLYKSFLEIAEELRPKAILIENVREFLNFNKGKFSADLLFKLDQLGYEVAYEKVCAANYGVPQMRWRVLFMAIRKDIADASGLGPSFPTATFGVPDSQLSLLGGVAPYRSVKDAIGDLPPPSLDKHKPLRYRTTARNDFGRGLRSSDGLLHNHFARKLSPKQIQRINAVGSGRMKHIDPELRTESFYGSAYRRLSWDEPALTITTWVYHVGSGRFAHPDEDRGITMREAARLQSFDDDFIFPPLVNPVSQMIGNAVPPLLATHFANTFAEILDRSQRVRAKVPA